MIAEKAIVCYRCGEPTADPAAAVQPSRPAPRRGWGDLAAATGTVALAATLVLTGQHGMGFDATVGGGAGLVVLATVMRRLR